jgi:hypothetical protein
MPVTVQKDGDAVVVCIPMTVKRVAGRKQIVVPQRLDEEPQPAAQEPIVVALARAFHWEKLLDEGRYATIAELAEALGVDRRYVGRILTLTSLAPSLVEAIVRGDEPSGLSLERLARGVPVEWEEQRAHFGFSFEHTTCFDLS